MSAHTPGPWEIWTSCSYRRIGSRATGREVAYPTNQISDGHPDICFPNGGADGPDARLIAAAPELLAALKEAVQEQWDSCHAYGDPSDPANTEGGAQLYREWAAVVAKAEGRA